MIDPSDDSEMVEDGGAGFVILRHPVPLALRGLVSRISGYREMPRRPVRMTETASLVVPIILGFGAPFSIALGREPGPGDEIGSFTAGLTLSPVQIASAGAAHCVQMDLTPLGARRFFGLPMRDLTDRMVTLDAVGDPALEALRQRLGNERNWSRRFAVAEAFLLSRLTTDAGPTPVAWAYRRILATGGALRVEQLSSDIGWSRKHLAARFHAEVGLPPKAIARIVRFGRARAMADAGEGTGWADIAAACGYADQAHLVREFRALAGVAPGAWRDRAG